tara:strand:- start:359 stop:1144 length:786 start_codon:yes stop_codon:yes gene_type:complete
MDKLHNFMEDIYKPFLDEIQASIENQGRNDSIKQSANEFLEKSIESRYSYNFTWLGRPIIQYPQDILAFQEIVFKVKPDLIIETGIAHGGSLVLSASILNLLDQQENIERSMSKRKVLGIDIDIRAHNKKALENHFLFDYIQLIEGSSISNSVAEKVEDFSSSYKNILVCLDSNHSHKHVLEELKIYSKLTSVNSYCIVFDTLAENLPKGMIKNRPWGKGDNPMTAVDEFLLTNNSFVQDQSIDNKLLISANPRGYLRRVN